MRTAAGKKTFPGKILKQVSHCKTGYLVVGLTINGKTKPFTVHSLLLAAFVGPKPSGKQALHNDGDRVNNTLENLSWGTPVENAADKIRHGKSGNKITSIIAADIKRRVAEGIETGVSIGKSYGISESTICDIKAGRYWNHV